MTAPRDRAIDAMTRIITKAQDAGADPRATASECLAATEGLGWRFQAGLAPADPHQAGAGLPKSDEVRALLDAARNQCDAATPVVRKDDPPRSAA